MLWYSTPWTATPFNNDPLWLTLFVEGVNDRLLDHCQVSSVPHYCGFKEQDTYNLYCMDGHLLKLKCKKTIILRYWFFSFLNKLQEKNWSFHHIQIFWHVPLSSTSVCGVHKIERDISLLSGTCVASSIDRFLSLKIENFTDFNRNIPVLDTNLAKCNKLIQIFHCQKLGLSWSLKPAKIL